MNTNDYKFTEFWVCGENKRPKWRFTRKDTLWQLTKISIEKGYDVYRGVFDYIRPDLRAEKIGDFHVDFDDENDLENSQQSAVTFIESLQKFYNIAPTGLEIVFSGSKGFGVIVPVESFLTDPINDIEIHYRKLGEFFALSCPCLDCSIYSKRRMWRITNSIHQKTQLYRIQLSFNQLQNLTIKEIREHAQRPQWIHQEPPEFSDELHGVLMKIINYREKYVIEYKTGKRDNDDYSRLTPEERIPKRLRHTHPEKTRNRGLTSLTLALKAVDVSRDDAEAIVLAFNERYCSPSKSYDEALVPVKHYYG